MFTKYSTKVIVEKKWKKFICIKSLDFHLGSGEERVNQNKNIHISNRESKDLVNASVCIKTLPNFPIVSEFAEICNIESI